MRYDHLTGVARPTDVRGLSRPLLAGSPPAPGILPCGTTSSASWRLRASSAFSCQPRHRIDRRAISRPAAPGDHRPALRADQVVGGDAKVQPTARPCDDLVGGVHPVGRLISESPHFIHSATSSCRSRWSSAEAGCSDQRRCGHIKLFWRCLLLHGVTPNRELIPCACCLDSTPIVRRLRPPC